VNHGFVAKDLSEVCPSLFLLLSCFLEWTCHKTYELKIAPHSCFVTSFISVIIQSVWVFRQLYLLIVGLLHYVCLCLCPRIAVLNNQSPVLLLQTMRSHVILYPHCRVKVQKQYHPLIITVLLLSLRFMAHQRLGLFTHWQGIVAFSCSRYVWKVHWQLMVQQY